MRYYKHLYLAEGLEKKKEKIIQKLEDNKLQISMHLLVLAQGDHNQLEILNSVQLLQPCYPKDDLFVVGLAKNYDEAIELVEKIMKEVYDTTKGTDMRSYIIKKEQED